MNDEIPTVPVEPARQALFERASIVWIVPIGALIIALGVAWSTWRERGPVIEVSFSDASGILANETELKYRNVSVGVVERVRFSENLDEVIASVRLDKDVAPFVDEGSQFWIVQPEVTAQGISGLDTVLSGVYIEGRWDNEAGGTAYAFQGLDDPPLTIEGSGGIQIELRSTHDKGMTENTPILYKGIEVGRIGRARISRDGRWVFADAIIEAPYNALVSTATRFWNVSGFSFSLGPNGAELDFSSIASLVAGGITFDTLVSGGRDVTPGAVFEVFEDEAAARTSIFEESDGSTVTLALIFEENISGLATGAPVEWRGVRIGEVVNVTGMIDETRFGDARVRLVSTVELRPARFGLPGDLAEDDVLAFLQDRIAEGLRARLVSASILTGGLKIELLTLEDAPPAELQIEAEPVPLFPVTESDIADVSATAEGVFQRINALPIEELLSSAINFMDNGTALIASDDVRETPGELRGLLEEVRGLVGSEAVQALPEDLGRVMADVQAATADLRDLLGAVREAELAERATSAINAISEATAAAGAAIETVPGLIENVNGLLAKVDALPLDVLASEATGLASEARALIGSESAQAIPATVESSLAALATLLEDLNQADTAAQLSRALSGAGEAATALEQSVAGVPDVVARLDRIAKNAEDVELDRLAGELEAVIAEARALFAQATSANLPETLSGAFREAEAALSELRAGGVVENANQTLASAREAATAIENAAKDLPGLVESIDRALRQAEQTLAGFEPNSPLARQTDAALRDIQRAAEAVSDLARTIERRPNSIILGR